MNTEIITSQSKEVRACMKQGIKNAITKFGTEPEKIVTHTLTALIVRDFLAQQSDEQKVTFAENINSLLSGQKPEVAENLRGKLLGRLNLFKSRGYQNLDKSTTTDQYEQDYLEITNIGHNIINDTGIDKLEGQWISEARAQKITSDNIYHQRRAFLGKIRDVVITGLVSNVVSKLGLSLYDSAVEGGYITSEEGLLPANLRELKQIHTEDIQITDTDRKSLSREFATWISPESHNEQVQLTGWLYGSGLEGVANTAKILMLTNNDIYQRHNGNISNYLRKEYLPEIQRICDESGLPRIAYLQFLEYNGAITYSYSLNGDIKDLETQAIFGAINTLVAHRLEFDLPVDAINFAGYHLPDNMYPDMPNGAYKAIRALYPTGTLMDLEYGVLARDVVALEKHLPNRFRKLHEHAKGLVSSSFRLVEAEDTFENQHTNLVHKVEEYVDQADVDELDKVWGDKFDNKEDPFWGQIGLGPKSKNVPAILHQLTNYTVAWEALVITDHQDLSVEHLQYCLNLAQDELIGRARLKGLKKGVASLLYDQLKNPHFRDELKKIASENNDHRLTLVLAEYSKLESLTTPFRDALAKNMHQFTREQFKPDVQHVVSIGTATWLDEMTADKESFPTLNEFRNNPFCRAFFMLCRREISEVNGGLVPEKGIRFRDINMPLQSLDQGASTLKKLDILMKIVKDKIQPIYKNEKDLGALVIDAMCKEMSNIISPELAFCFPSYQEYTSWKDKEFNPQKDKLLGWFVWSGTHLAINRYMQIKG